MWLYVPDADAAFKRAVDAGAKATMPPADMFWGDRCAGVADPYGYLWSFATHQKDLTEEEMRRAGEEFARSMGAGGAGANPYPAGAPAPAAARARHDAQRRGTPAASSRCRIAPRQGSSPASGRR